MKPKQKEVSGTFMVRLDPPVYRRVVRAHRGLETLSDTIARLIRRRQS